MSCLCREEHELLEAVQARLVVHPLTSPVLGNDHDDFRSRENPVRKVEIDFIYWFCNCKKQALCMKWIKLRFNSLVVEL